MACGGTQLPVWNGEDDPTSGPLDDRYLSNRTHPTKNNDSHPSDSGVIKWLLKMNVASPHSFTLDLLDLDVPRSQSHHSVWYVFLPMCNLPMSTADCMEITSEHVTLSCQPANLYDFYPRIVLFNPLWYRVPKWSCMHKLSSCSSLGVGGGGFGGSLLWKPCPSLLYSSVSLYLRSLKRCLGV